ncbi:hypothetical protein E308F_17040 [Moorella sp. E308F]|uniref:CHAP domain-containing protein n=1 Tax=Moorella sp. E308F TaxID=2572682 RepID=UPI0010FFAED1|nr:CHAP domain-containing protein [Moorella sp. E308F]GEA15460.1 hypothetical protein E308F_17040 [Moorella sp. E308F]GEA19682.1 hypothetical protein E306M_28200 [Moorella sp. E306M]
MRSLKTSAALFCIVLLFLVPSPASANPYTLWDGGNCCWYVWEMAKENWGVYLPWVGDARNWTNLDGTMISKDGRIYRVEAVDEPSASSIMVLQPKTLDMLNGNKPYPNNIYGHVAWVDSVSSLKIFADSTTYFCLGGRLSTCGNLVYGRRKVGTPGAVVPIGDRFTSGHPGEWTA